MKKGINRKAVLLILCLAMAFLFISCKSEGGTEVYESTDYSISSPRMENEIVTYDCIWFGNYPQSDATGETSDPIKWRVLSINGDEALLVADKSLDVYRYDEDWGDVTWETCTIRSWLNGYNASYNKCGNDYTSSNFIDRAFTSAEQSVICSKTIENADNPEYGTEGGNDTTDKVFLLSYDDVTNTDYGFSNSYSDDDKARVRENTAYVTAKCFEVYSEEECWDWHWLPLPGYYSDVTMIVEYIDCMYRDGVDDIGAEYAVCPALYLNLSYSNMYSYAGTVSTDGSINEVEYHPDQ